MRRSRINQSMFSKELIAISDPKGPNNCSSAFSNNGSFLFKKNNTNMSFMNKFLEQR